MVSMLVDAEKLLSYELDEAVFRPYLRGNLLRIADIIGVSATVRIACALPMAVLAFPSRNIPDQRLADIVGNEAANAVAGEFGAAGMTYLQIPAGCFSIGAAKVITAIGLMKKGASFDEAARLAGPDRQKLATEVRRLGILTARTEEELNARCEAEKRAKKMLASGVPVSKIAARLGVSERSARRWAQSSGDMSPKRNRKCATKSRA